MANPELVAECVAAMKTKVNIPVTIKTRIGIDDLDSYEFLCQFINTVSQAGCETFIIHARKAWLHGLSPRQNREIPPLKYETVYNLKSDFPGLEFIINGGITSIVNCNEHLQRVDGVMIGRAVCNNPYLLAQAGKMIFNDHNETISRSDVLKNFITYADSQLSKGTSLHEMTRHILGLFQGQPGARIWRRYLSENIFNKKSGIEVIENALTFIQAA
jgi:tRNA-dihydrouridine synthase A